MTCERCGKWAPPDPATGYDADTLCPECEEFEEDLDADWMAGTEDEDEEAEC